MLIVAVDIEAGLIEVVSAGHTAPILIDGHGSRFVPAHVGVPVGVAREGDYPSTTASFDRGATLLLFTDGLFERRGETIDDGLARLLASVGAVAEHDLDRLLGDLTALQRNGDTHDDTALLGVRR